MFLRSSLGLLFVVALFSREAQADPVPCWDGTGPAIEPGVTAPLPPFKLSKGYPAVIATLDRKELDRREALLAARNPGMTFTLDAHGLVKAVHTRRISCATRDMLEKTGALNPSSQADNPILVELDQRNADVIGDASIAFESARRASDGAWEATLSLVGVPAYRSAVEKVGGKTLSDAAIFKAVAARAKVERLRIVYGDSCGPACGPPPVSTTVLGVRALRPSDLYIERYFGVYRTRTNLVVRRVTGVSLSIPSARLTGGLKFVDSVTAEPITAEPEDLWVPEK